MTQYTVAKGSILMASRKLARVGDILKPEDFKGYEKQLQILLQKGNLVQGNARTESLASNRGVGDFAPIPKDATETKDGKGRRLTSKLKPSQVQAKLESIKVAQAARSARQEKLAEHEGEEFTPAEAQALGL